MRGYGRIFIMFGVRKFSRDSGFVLGFGGVGGVFWVE